MRGGLVKFSITGVQEPGASSGGDQLPAMGCASTHREQGRTGIPKLQLRLAHLPGSLLRYAAAAALHDDGFSGTGWWTPTLAAGVGTTSSNRCRQGFHDAMARPGRFLLAATVFLALGLGVDIYVVVQKIGANDYLSLMLATASVVLLLGLWHAWPWLGRSTARRRPYP
jgi:hypothetical protein